MSVIKTAVVLANSEKQFDTSVATNSALQRREVLIPLTADGSKVRTDATISGTIEVHLDPSNDGVEIYGSSDGGTTQKVVKTDANGELQVDVLSIPAITGAVSITTLGQADDAGSVPVTISSDQTDVNDFVNTNLGTVLDGTQDSVATGSTDNGATNKVMPLTDVNDRWDIACSTQLPASLGSLATASSLSVALSVDDAAKVPSLGQTNDAGSVPVTISSDQCDVNEFVNVNLGTVLDAAQDSVAIGSTDNGATGKVMPLTNVSNQLVIEVATLPAVSGTVSVSNLPLFGLTTYRNIDLDETGVNVKASPGVVMGWHLFNQATTTRFVKFYDKATAPSVGVDTPLMTVPLPAGGGATVNFTSGITFSTGIGVGATTGIADADTGAPAGNDVIVDVFYQ